MGFGALLTSFVAYIQIRIIYRDIKYYLFDEPQEVQGEFSFNIWVYQNIIKHWISFIELKNEIAVWERTGASVSSYSKGEEAVKESLMKQTLKLQNKLKQTVSNASIIEGDYATTLDDLIAKVSMPRNLYLKFYFFRFSIQ